ncbi:MAG: hypothetical protein GXP14_11985 [Gammaproteobacteria bacterium]|nr:hypothetical protein [Gammaproteobacteria bacterium]
MMDVKTYSDEQLQRLLKDIHKELDQRKMERIKLAKEQIKKLATEAGIAVSFSDAKAPRKRTQKIQTGTQPVTKEVEIKTTEKSQKTENKELEEVM